MNTTEEIVIPEISDEILTERLGRIKFVIQAMSGLDGKPYPTDETDKKLFDLFYVESNVDPRTQSFNFDDKKKITGKAVGITEILTKDIFIKVGGYHGFLKMTMAEVLSQIPEDIVNDVVAFALNPEKNAEVIDGGNHQVVSIIFYGKADNIPDTEVLPSSQGLLKPIDYEKANRLKNLVRPIINYTEHGFMFVDPGNIDEPFMHVGIWIRVNGSNLHRTNTETKVTESYKLGNKISLYQSFTHGADFYKPTYAYLISQVPDELITENTIGLLYRLTDYFKTKEGVLHKTEYILVEKA